MRRAQGLCLLGWLKLSEAARQPGFSIHHDLLAYPQFEVVLSESFISEPDADALLKKTDPSRPNYEADIIGHADGGDGSASQGAHGIGRSGDHVVGEAYEIMNMPPYRYLCAIPVIEPPPALNETATELAKAEEARELERATANGWDLVNGLQGTCLYYVSGWWSYSFCYGDAIVQFHALPQSVKAGNLPQKDPKTMQYVLGRALPSGEEGETTSVAPANSELQVKGDHRYLVQRLNAGTLCDLTGRERTIEVQYHCSPGTTQDRIGWIKEVTTCAYLMTVFTPRLCNDVAFQPPKETRANIISCRAIISEAEEADWRHQKTLEAQSSMLGQDQGSPTPVTIGGVTVGGRHLLGRGEDGKEAPKLAPPRTLGDSLIEIVAQGLSKEQGGSVQVKSHEDLEKMDIPPELVEEFRRQLEALAGDSGWKLEVVEVEGGERELQGVVEGDEDEEEEGEWEESQDGDDGSQEKFYQRDEL